MMFKACVGNETNFTIPYMISGQCYQYGIQGPCEDGELFFLVPGECYTEAGVSVIHLTDLSLPTTDIFNHKMALLNK